MNKSKERKKDLISCLCRTDSFILHDRKRLENLVERFEKFIQVDETLVGSMKIDAFLNNHENLTIGELEKR